MSYCPECGEQITKEDVFCPFCGISLKPIAPVEDDRLRRALAVLRDLATEKAEPYLAVV